MTRLILATALSLALSFAALAQTQYQRPPWATQFGFDYLSVGFDEDQNVVFATRPLSDEENRMIINSHPLIYIGSWDDLKCTDDKALFVRLEARSKKITLTCE